MNREQRRALEKRVRKRGASPSEAKKVVELANNLDFIRQNGAGKPSPAKEFAEGDKAKLDVDLIKSRRNYDRMLQGYKDFVEGNGNEVFTVHVESPHMISFVEEPKWLFWSGDLIKVDE